MILMRVELSLVLSAIAIVMSGASLTWQIVAWQRSGAVLRVHTSQSFIPWPHGPVGQYVSVTARNSGRAAATVVAWGLRFPNGDSLVQFRPLPIEKPLPHRLEAGDGSTT
jgi:hypothetical protein